MTVPAATPAPNVGFLAILQDPSGTLGGYLVTNSWGRPLEFRLTSAVQPNRVQAILYGSSLQPYLCGEIIARTLVEKSTAPIRWLVTDSPHVLELRRHVDFPIVLSSAAPPDGLVMMVRNLHVLPEFAGDLAAIEANLAQSPSLDLSEPFVRIREAVAEARKLGLAQRAAA
jgi:hypothetical protein